MKQLTIEEANKMIHPGRSTEEYQKDYDYIMNLAESRGLDKSKIDFYCETHHRIPRSQGGTDDEFNLVNLSYLEHLICHILLYRIYPNDIKIFIPAYGMINGFSVRNSKRVLKTLSKSEYETILKSLDLNTIIELKNRYIQSKSKPTICYDDNFIVKRIFPSLESARKYFGLKNPSPIKQSIVSDYRKSCGYNWDFLDHFKQFHSKELEFFLNLKEKPDIQIPTFGPSKSYSVVCFLPFSKIIIKIYNRVMDVEEDGFGSSQISSIINSSKIGVGYGWDRLERFNIENPNSLNLNLTPIPILNFKSGMYEISSDNIIINEFKTIPDSPHSFYNAFNYYKDSKILEKWGSRWIKVIDYIDMFPLLWEDYIINNYLRHKQLNKLDEKGEREN